MSFSSKEVCDQPHELQQGDRVISAAKAHMETEAIIWTTNAGQMWLQSYNLKLVSSIVTHSEAMKLHSEEERGTYSAIREVRANT